MNAADGSADGVRAAERTGAPAPETPYRGLAPFAEGDFDYFFGRKKDASHIAASTITESLVVLFGPSGVGKSSVLGAALPRALDAIIDGTLFVSFFRWEEGFYPTLLKQAKARAGAPAEVEIGSLEALADYWIKAHATPVVFVFDQFEQYFLIPLADTKRSAGVDPAFEIDLARTINRRDLDAHVLISIREDALYELDRLRGRLPCILSDPVRLDYIDRASAEQAIRKPLRVFRERHGEDAGPVTIDGDLAAELLAQARRSAYPEQYETPYLQLVLERLWNEERKLGSALLRFDTYRRLNGWEGIATSHVSHTLETTLSEDERAICASLFDRMVTPSGMKITLAAEDLALMIEAPTGSVEAVLTALGHPDSRIIRSVAPAHDSGQRRYEIFHDVLARPILAWKHAFNAEREQRVLREEAEREQERLRAEAEAERKRQQREIDAQTRRATVQRRIAKRFQLISVAATLLAVLALLFAGWAGYSYREAAKQRARVLALRADWATNNGDSRQGLLLALEALPESSGFAEWMRRPIIEEATHALERALFRPFGRALPKHPDRVTRIAYSPDGETILTGSEDGAVRLWRAQDDDNQKPPVVLQHQSPISAARFSRDGRFVISAAQDGWAYIWDAASGAKVTEWPVSIARPTVVDLSPDNTQIAAVSFGENASLWTWDPDQFTAPGNLAAPPQLRTELWDDNGATHEGGTNFVAFDTAGQRLVTTSWGGEARIWDGRTARLIRTLPRAMADAEGRCQSRGDGHCAPIVSAAFSPAQADRVVTASSDHSARIWDVSTGRVIRSLIGHDRPVTFAAFNADGSRVITAALDGTVRVWAAESGEMLQVLQGPKSVAGTMASASLSLDESRVAASFSDLTPHIWEVRGDLQPFVLPRLSEAVPSAALSADNSRLIAASGLAVGLYDARSGRAVSAPRYFDHTVMAVAASARGSEMLAAAGDEIHIFAMDAWSESRPPHPLRSLVGHRSLILDASYSPDGKRIVTASQDGTARIWRASTGEGVGKPLPHEGAVFSAVFDREGARILTGSFDGTARIWSAEDGEALRVLRVGAPVLEAGFSGDGRHVVVTALDMPQAPEQRPPFFETTSTIWDAETGTRLETGDREALQNVKFLQLANNVVVGTSDGVVRLSGALDEEPVAILPAHRGSIQRLATSPGGERLATISADGVIRVWNLPPADPHALVAYANDIADRYIPPADRRFSPKERKAFGLDQHDRPLQEWLKVTWRSMFPL